MLKALKDVRWLRHFNRTLTVVCLLSMPAVAWLYFARRDVFQAVSILGLAELSLYNTAQGHFGAWQTSRAEEAAKA